tara:strand:- start:735 stop:1055 length:321 start_codon:yes stop_codon:yes gene_type:complete
MNKFETVLLFSSDLTKSNLNKLEDLFKDQLKKQSASIIDEEDWGLRDLSYQIKKNKKAFYKFFQIEIDGSKIQEIKENLNKEEQIIRYLFVKVDEHLELPTKMIEK